MVSILSQHAHKCASCRSWTRAHKVRRVSVITLLHSYTMALAHLPRVALIGACVAFGLVLDTTLPETIFPETLTNGSSMRHLNLTSRLDNMEFICNGGVFGRGLALNSCGDANRQMSFNSQTPRTWGLRGTGAFDVDLPLRFISGIALNWWMDGRSLTDIFHS